MEITRTVIFLDWRFLWINKGYIRRTKFCVILFLVVMVRVKHRNVWEN